MPVPTLAKKQKFRCEPLFLCTFNLYRKLLNRLIIGEIKGKTYISYGIISYRMKRDILSKISQETYFKGGILNAI